MAALRRLQNITTHIARPSYFFLSRRGVASKLFIGGLSFYTTEKGLSETFSQFGQVIEAKVVTDRVSDKSKGFGFVTYASQDEAETALKEMNGKPLNGRVIFVDYARPKTFGGGMPIARGPPELPPQQSVVEEGTEMPR
nr:glycine-rich RNA-binding protein 4, mitochondrial-like [Ipomoea batatas]